MHFFNNVKIGENAKIGAGSLVNKNIKSNTLAFGRPIKEIKDMIKNLSHVSMPYINLKKVIDFYVKILGLKIVHKFKNKKK